MKVRVRDREEKLKKLENRSFRKLGTRRRVDLTSTRIIVDDDDNQSDPLEPSNEECTQNVGENSYAFYPETQAQPSQNVEGCSPSKHNTRTLW